MASPSFIIFTAYIYAITHTRHAGSKRLKHTGGACALVKRQLKGHFSCCRHLIIQCVSSLIHISRVPARADRISFTEQRERESALYVDILYTICYTCAHYRMHIVFFTLNTLFNIILFLFIVPNSLTCCYYIYCNFFRGDIRISNTFQFLTLLAYHEHRLR